MSTIEATHTIFNTEVEATAAAAQLSDDDEDFAYAVSVSTIAPHRAIIAVYFTEDGDFFRNF